MGTVVVSTLPSGGTLLNLASGTLAVVTSLANQVKGTITRVENGTIGLVSQANVTLGTFGADLPGGTIDNVTFGTFDTFYRHPDNFATVVSSGTSTLGTVKAAVSGSAIYVTDIVISATSATDVVVASGGTSTPILGTVHLAADGGMVGNFHTPIRTASGSALVYKQSANVGLTITATGYVD